MSNFSLKNKHILIVGASSGIGMEITKQCAFLGAKLTITTRDIEGLKLKLKNINNEVDYITYDVFEDGDLNQIIKNIEPIDGFVYTPGVVNLFPAQFINKKHIDEVRIPIFDGAVLLISSLLRLKKINNNASLTFISSISSTFPYKGGAIYTSSKAALETYSKTLALELAPKKIRVNCIKAGLVETKILEDTKNNMDENIYEKHTEKYPLGLGKPEDIANAIIFLLSDASKWITGTEIILDGGLTAGA